MVENSKFQPLNARAYISLISSSSLDMDRKIAGFGGSFGDWERVGREPGRAGTGGGLVDLGGAASRGGETGGVAGSTCTTGLVDFSADVDGPSWGLKLAAPNVSMRKGTGFIDFCSDPGMGGGGRAG